MKEFIYDNTILDKRKSDKIISRLIYTFFKGNIRKKKIMVNGELKEKTYFSFRTPFNSSGGKIVYPERILELFNNENLYVLVHYAIEDNKNPLFFVGSKELVFDLNNVDNMCFYEYSYIFDKYFTHCFFITDSDYYDGNKNIAILQEYRPLEYKPLF